ncbi:MAG: hypothetical protein ACRDRJ_43440 [Streptosporangiaceae bacterium]
MYDDPVAEHLALIAVEAPGGSAFYRAHVPIRDRAEPGFRFVLPDAGPWQWAGPGDPVAASLADVLAAAGNARIAGLPGYDDIDLAALHDAHQQAIVAAMDAGRDDLARHLLSEQAEVSAASLVGEEDAARDLEITAHSLDVIRLQYKSICPPVLIAGNQRTKWFWARGQFAAWKDTRPGKGWRRGKGSRDPARAGRRPVGRGAERATA